VIVCLPNAPNQKINRVRLPKNYRLLENLLMLIPWKEIYLAAILKPGWKILFLKFLRKSTNETAHPQDVFEYNI
jgi:hypothetical protein